MLSLNYFMTITTYLFDLDDTLINSKIYIEIYTPILEMIKEKLNLNDEELAQKAKKLGLNKSKKLNQWDTGDLCRELDLLDEYYQILEEKIKVISVLQDNVKELLTKLKDDGKIIGITSNSMARTIKLYLDKYELTKLVDFVFSLDDAGFSMKKEDNYWETLIKRHNLKPGQCLVIGDDPIDDVKMPKRFGFHTFLIRNPEDLMTLI